MFWNQFCFGCPRFCYCICCCFVMVWCVCCTFVSMVFGVCVFLFAGSNLTLCKVRLDDFFLQPEINRWWKWVVYYHAKMSQNEIFQYAYAYDGLKHQPYPTKPLIKCHQTRPFNQAPNKTTPTKTFFEIVQKEGLNKPFEFRQWLMA